MDAADIEEYFLARIGERLEYRSEAYGRTAHFVIEPISITNSAIRADVGVLPEASDGRGLENVRAVDCPFRDGDTIEDVLRMSIAASLFTSRKDLKRAIFGHAQDLIEAYRIFYRRQPLPAPAAHMFMRAADLGAYFSKKVAKPISLTVGNRNFEIEPTVVEDGVLHAMVSEHPWGESGRRRPPAAHLAETHVPFQDGDTVEGVLRMTLVGALFRDRAEFSRMDSGWPDEFETAFDDLEQRLQTPDDTFRL